MALILLAVVLAGTMLSACAGNGPDQGPTPTPSTNGESAFEGQVNEILDQMINRTIEEKNLDDEELKNIACYDKPIDSDSARIFSGWRRPYSHPQWRPQESKPEGSWFAHSIVLIACKESADVAALAGQISKGTNPARFGCIKAEAIVVGYAGRYILLCASCRNTCDAVYATFSEMSAVPATRIDRENDWDGGGILG
jgi:hypothetical protein